MNPTVVERRTRPVAVILIIGIALAIGAGIVWWLSQAPDPEAGAPLLTPEAKAYTRNLQLDGVQMKATDNSLGQTLVEILGSITNAGDRPVSNVVLRCVFYDPYSQLLVREAVAIVRARDGVLHAGETRKFRLAFDALPEGWNQAMPQLVIAEIRFGDGE